MVKFVTSVIAFLIIGTTLSIPVSPSVHIVDKTTIAVVWFTDLNQTSRVKYGLSNPGITT
jgi:hypothetical protein